MKIQYLAPRSFQLSNKTQSVLFNPDIAPTEAVDCIINTSPDGITSPQAKKSLHLPGEFEISEILIRSYQGENRTNSIFKIFFEETTIVHFGDLKDIPTPKMFEQIGESIDIALISISAEFPAKKAKELVEKIEPRMAIFGGEPQFFAEISALMSIKTAENNPMDIQKSKLPDESTDLFILPL